MYYLSNIFILPGTVLNALQMLTHLILITDPWVISQVTNTTPIFQMCKVTQKKPK